MPVKEDLKKKVPDFVKETPEWTVFLRWISQRKITTRTQLKSKIDTEIKECQELMKTSMKSMRGGTNTRIVRSCAKKLDFLKLAKNKIIKYI